MPALALDPLARSMFCACKNRRLPFTDEGVLFDFCYRCGEERVPLRYAVDFIPQREIMDGTVRLSA